MLLWTIFIVVVMAVFGIALVGAAVNLKRSFDNWKAAPARYSLTRVEAAKLLLLVIPSGGSAIWGIAVAPFSGMSVMAGIATLMLLFSIGGLIDPRIPGFWGFDTSPDLPVKLKVLGLLFIAASIGIGLAVYFTIEKGK